MSSLVTKQCFSAKNLKAYFSHTTFNTPDNKPFVETYLSFIANSLYLKPNPNNKLQAEIEIQLNFTQNGEIVNGMKYKLSSPEFDDSAKIYNFVDQQRFELAQGNYGIELIMTDLNAPKPFPFAGKDSIKVAFSGSLIDFSSIQLVESYKKTETPNILTKSGYDLTPYVANFYPENLNRLIYYSEIYNTDKVASANETFVVFSYIEDYDSEQKITGFNTFNKFTAKNVIVCFNEFNITELPSGNYNLVLELRNKSNLVVATNKAFFQRSNPKYQIKTEDLATVNVENTFVTAITNKDTLQEYIRFLSPISNQMEMTFASNSLKTADVALMQKFFYNFWKHRDNLNPDAAWQAYHEQVILVNKMYRTTSMKGYMTDRGRVYLKYGKPNQLSKFENEPSMYPYEVWQYYKLDQRNNRKFVFYNPDLVTNNYQLIHSDAIGERRDDRWQVKLAKRNNAINNLDQNTTPNNFGSHIEDVYTNPR